MVTSSSVLARCSSDRVGIRKVFFANAAGARFVRMRVMSLRLEKWLKGLDVGGRLSFRDALFPVKSLFGSSSSASTPTY